MTTENKFDPLKEFFVIDSEHLDQVRPKLYGFTIQEDGIWEEETLPPGKTIERNGLGAYVLIEKNDSIITIHQDFLGSYGLYFYRNGGSFVLSNSFLRLEEYLVGKGEKLTINLDFANHLVVSGLCSVAYSSTLVNEISVLSREAIVTIDCKIRTIEMKTIPGQENTVEIDSEEGMAILDHWHDRWVGIIRSLNKQAPLMFDLTGGFDTRLTFLLALNSGINLKNAYIFSTTDGLHTHKEDLAIAEKICDYYGLPLNRNVYSDDGEDFSLEDIINLSFYTKMPFHNQMHFKHRRYCERRFRFNGNGGGMLRGYQFMTPDAFAKMYKDKADKRFMESSAKEINRSIDRIIKEASDAVMARYDITEDTSEWIPYHMYRETRARNHFGKFQVEEYFSNAIAVSPLLDPNLARLKFSNDECDDPNLLITVIMLRYCEDLLRFKIDSGRSFQQKTIDYAGEINKRFPRETVVLFCEDNEAEKEETEDRKSIPYAVSVEERDSFLLNVYQSRRTRQNLKSVFPADVFYHPFLFLKTESYFPMQQLFPILSAAKIMEDLNGEELCTETTFKTLSRMMDQTEEKDEVFAIMDWMIPYMVENRKLKKEIRKEKKKQNSLKKDIEKLKESRSYRIGRKITYLPRKIKESFHN